MTADEDRRSRWVLGALLSAAFAIRFYAASVSPSIHWPDEIFQSLEQAHRLVYGPGIVPWEFRAGARSWLLPGALAGVMRAFGGLSTGASGYLGAVRAVLSMASLSAPAVAFFAARRERGSRAALAASVVACAWFELVYFAPKALSEVVATHLLLPGLYLCRAPASRRRLLAAGALLGLAVALRMQLAVAVMVPLVAIARARDTRKTLAFAAAAAAPVLAAGVLDAITWSYPFQSYWVNFRTNVVENRSAAYGTAPWHAYAGMLGRIWSWGALVVVPLAILGARRWPALALSAGLVFVLHSALGHKEYRFVYPCVAILVVLASIGVAEAAAIAARACTRRPAALAWGIALAAAGVSATLAARYDWHDAYAGHRTTPAPMWAHKRGMLFAFESLSSDKALCGVGLANRRWNETGGYAYLHRDVPIFEIRSDRAFERFTPAMNALVASGSAAETLGPFSRGPCRDDVCLYRREGPCEPAAGYDINERLRSVGE